MTDAYYPLFLSLKDKLCVVVGGGRVAERKVRGLLKAGARVRVVSPAVTRGILALGLQGRIEISRKEYREGDLEGAVLVFAATGIARINAIMREESLRLSVPLNVVDNPDLCDFIVPSVVRKHPILIAISTSGILPMLSKKLRMEMIGGLSADYGTYAKRVGAFRKFLMENVNDASRRKEILGRIGKAGIPEIARMSLKQMKERFLEAGTD